MSPQHWPQRWMWACPTGASSTSPSRCESWAPLAVCPAGGGGGCTSLPGPSCQWGRGHGGQREQLLRISDFALQRAPCGCPLFLHFSLPSLVLISTKQQVNHRTREAQLFFPLVIIRGLRVRDSFRLKVECQPRRLGLPSFGLSYPAGPAALREVRGSPRPPPTPWWCRVGSFPGSKSALPAPAARHGDFCPCRYTMTKSSAVLFILIFSLIFKLEELVRPQLSSRPASPHRC